MKWNGNHWLIGDSKGALKKYDGKTFVDLTPKLEAALQPPAAPLPKPELPRNYKNLAFILAAIALLVLVFLVCRKKS